MVVSVAEVVQLAKKPGPEPEMSLQFAPPPPPPPELHAPMMAIDEPTKTSVNHFRI